MSLSIRKKKNAATILGIINHSVKIPIGQIGEKKMITVPIVSRMAIKVNNHPTMWAPTPNEKQQQRYI